MKLKYGSLKDRNKYKVQAVDVKFLKVLKKEQEVTELMNFLSKLEFVLISSN
jgi:hypothetical protein